MRLYELDGTAIKVTTQIDKIELHEKEDLLINKAILEKEILLREEGLNIINLLLVECKKLGL